MPIPLLIPLAITAAGTVTKVFGDIKEANQREDIAKQEAANKRLQAAETLRRGDLQEVAMRKQGAQIADSQTGYYSHGGVEMSGSPLLVLESTQAQVEQDISEMQQESQFRASQLNKGARHVRPLGSRLLKLEVLECCWRCLRFGREISRTF
jgi:hypothetical protein